MKRIIVAAVSVLFAGSTAFGALEITEWMYSGTNGEFIEVTNTSPAAIDLTGWSFDDDSRVPGTLSLSSLGTVAPGESFIITEVAASDFRTAWGLPASVKVLGGNTYNLGRNDEINIFDAANALADRLTYGDQSFLGTPRTQYKSCNIPATDYGFTTAQTSWVLATVGDAYGSWASTGGDIGSPGRIPEPMTMGLLAAGALLGLRRRRVA